MSSYTDSLISLSSRGNIHTVISVNPLRDFVQYNTSLHPCNTTVFLCRMNPRVKWFNCLMRPLYFQPFITEPTRTNENQQDGPSKTCIRKETPVKGPTVYLRSIDEQKASFCNTVSGIFLVVQTSIRLLLLRTVTFPFWWELRRLTSKTIGLFDVSEAPKRLLAVSIAGIHLLRTCWTIDITDFTSSC